MASGAPIIQTLRLQLRAIRPEDAEDVFAYSRNPTVLRYTGGKTPTVLSETQQFIESLMDGPPDDFEWAMRLKSDPRVVGIVDFGLRDATTGAVHYALAEEHWNKGLMTEAVRAVLDWAFGAYPKLKTVTTSAVTVNIGSRRVMEKCGMSYLGCIREKWDKFDDPVALAVYSISRATWDHDRHNTTET